MILMRTLTLTILIVSLLPALAMAQGENPNEFRVPKSTLDAAERRLNSETNPYKKLQLLLRWIKIKEEYEKTAIFESEKLKRKSEDDKLTEAEIKKLKSEITEAKSEQLENTKKLIIARIEKELPILYRAEGINVEQLFRELGFRYLEIRNFRKSIENFMRIPNRLPDDELALGDAYIQADQIDMALISYATAAKSQRIRNLASYKRAWAFMRTNDFVNALAEFDKALEPNPNASAQLLEEAFNDRIRPYLETFREEAFTKEDANEFKALAKRIYPTDPQRAKDLFVKSLKMIVEGFTAKSQIEKAQNAFFFLSQEIEDTTEVLILSAPTWIKVYRARLDHKEVQRIILALPSSPLKAKDSVKLKAELYNTAVFYETYKENEEKDEDAKDLLQMTYGKYFELYPGDKDADPLRVNYSKILLEAGKAEKCLAILSNRGKDDKEIEKIAYSLEGKCELKFLDKLYAKKHDEFFYKRLEAALLRNKLYKRPDLGLPEKNIYQGLVRMVMGSLQKNSQESIMRSALNEIIDTYPYDKKDKLYNELRVTKSELLFENLMAERKKPSEKAPEFFEIFKTAPVGSPIALKSITNSIIMGNNQETLDRCDTYAEKYTKEFKPDSGVFDRCIQIAEHFLILDKEYSYWIKHEKTLNADQTLRLGLLELGLSKKGGRERILALNSEKANQVVELWEGASEKRVKLNPQWQRLANQKRAFLNRLNPIKFKQIQKSVPQQIKAFDKVDDQLVKFYEKNPAPLWMAKVLEARSEIAGKMSNWMNSLPVPPGLTPEEMAEYQAGSQEIVKPWIERADKRKKECSEVAHTLSPDFKNASEEFCPEETPATVLRKSMDEWKSSIQKRPRVQNIVKIILAKARGEENKRKAKYYLFRGLELSKNDSERALVHLELARTTGKDRFWVTAAALDGGLSEPIQWLKDQAKGNPFYENLYSAQIRYLRSISQTSAR